MATADTPKRVVSMNLCTDQLAMMLAEPGQLLAVSRVARDVMSSAMAAEAAHVPTHSSAAEEVYLLKPDLVLAGTYTSRASVNMLRRLGIRVEKLPIAISLEQVSANMRQMGAWLGQDTAAETMAAEFERAVAELRARVTDRPRAALYYANGYSLGDQTLAGQILLAAGYANVATELGHAYGGNLALEQLVMSAPDLVITGEKYPGASRSEELLDHPAVQALATASNRGADWICGTPYVLRAITDLQGGLQHGLQEASQ